MNANFERPFADLPSALVDEVLRRTQEVGEALLGSFHDLQLQKITRRKQLADLGLLGRESDFEYVAIPTTCGIDGSYAVERLLAVDLVAVAAVAMEGLTPPSENRFWPEPRHQVLIEAESHDADIGTIARALMIGMELSLAVQAPHEVVFLDGSLTTPIIFLNQALNKIQEDAQHLKTSQKLLARVKDVLEAYLLILRAHRSDKYWVAVPKYTTRREIGKLLEWPETQDDRSILTGLLEPGEITGPTDLQNPEKPWHLNINPIRASDVAELVEEIKSHLCEIQVVYYRPSSALPALRLEMSRSVAKTPARLASVLHAIRHQCGVSAMIEPYPLYMADRMVKSLATAIPTFRQVASQHMAENYRGNVGDIFLGLHGYRTETGR